MAKQLPKRSEVDEALQWDLTRVFPNDEAFEKEWDHVQSLATAFEQYKGTLQQSAEHLRQVIGDMMQLYRRLEVVYVYASMKNDQDTTNATYQAMEAKATSLYTFVIEKVSFFEPELMAIPQDVMAQFLEDDILAGYRHFLDQILRQRAHILSHQEEELLASASEIFSAPSQTFEILNNADLKFPVVKNDDGEDVQLSHGVYGQLMESLNRDVRRDAFQSLYRVYDQFQHTTASTLASHVKSHNFNAKVRHYQSAREASLYGNAIPESVYDNLVEVVNEKLPLLHRYVALRKELLGVDELHMYDMYTPILGETGLSYTYEEAKEKALEALAPLGDDYIHTVKEAFNQRWIDVVENEGKRSGAYSSGVYDTDPYILLNWHDSLDQLFTLVHEMGHSMHSYYTRHHQPYVYGDYSIFLAEIASTTNENLLTEYLLKTETDPKIRAAVLNHYLDGFKGTVFRQTQFAEFEQWIHQTDAEGTPLTSEVMNEYYRDMNARYYGPAVVNDEEIALEWSRIPHFYYNFYVYQYATGFSAATALSRHILEGGKEERERYLDYLKAGSSDYPIDVMKKANVDMTKKDYLYDAFDVFEQRLNELEELVKSLKK